MNGAMHVSPPTICCYGMHLTYYVRVAEALYVVFWFYRKTFCRVAQFDCYLTLIVVADLLCYIWQNV